MAQGDGAGRAAKGRVMETTPAIQQLLREVCMDVQPKQPQHSLPAGATSCSGQHICLLLGLVGQFARPLAIAAARSTARRASLPLRRHLQLLQRACKLLCRLLLAAENHDGGRHSLNCHAAYGGVWHHSRRRLRGRRLAGRGSLHGG